MEEKTGKWLKVIVAVVLTVTIAVFALYKNAKSAREREEKCMDKCNIYNDAKLIVNCIDNCQK